MALRRLIHHQLMTLRLKVDLGLYPRHIFILNSKNFTDTLKLMFFTLGNGPGAHILRTCTLGDDFGTCFASTVRLHGRVGFLLV